jgi:hypothetical protein
MGVDDIREQPPGAMVRTQKGYTHERRFKVFARSEMDAFNKLQAFRNVFIGAAWFTTYNEQPDASVVCRRVAIDPGASVPAPLNGVGDYMVTASYEKPDRDEAVAGGGPVYRLQTSLQSAPIDVDGEGDPITNLAGEPVQLSDFEDREVLSVEWYAKYASLAACFQAIRPYRNSLNLLSWQGLAKGWARCGGIVNVEETYVDDGVWVKLQTSVEVREGVDTAAFGSLIVDKTGATVGGTLEGWAKLALHQGTRELGAVVDGVQQYKPILSQDGADQIAEPVPLDENGARLPAADDPVYITWNVVPKYKDLNLLGI